MPDCEFTFDHYIETCKAHHEAGTRLFLRHDVDFELETAMKFAVDVEHANGINGNYFLRMDSPYYNPWEEVNSWYINMIREHQELGLHYTANYIDGKIILRDILAQVIQLETIADVKINTISQHKPLTHGRNNDLIQWLNYEKLIDVNQNSNLKYLSDSGMNWREGCFCKHIGKYDALHVNTHPIWWGEYARSREDILQTWAHKKTLKNEKAYKDRIREFNEYDKKRKEEKKSQTKIKPS